MTKEEYLKLLAAVLKEQEIDDVEINKEYLEEPEPGPPPFSRFNYVSSHGIINATNMTRQEIDSAWVNQGNIIVGDFMLKVSSFTPVDKRTPVAYIYFNLYDYEKDDKGKPVATKIDVLKDIRFANTNVDWKEYCDRVRIAAPLPITLDIIEWLQKLDKFGAFV